jgi:micrococcal nuclease
MFYLLLACQDITKDTSTSILTEVEKENRATSSGEEEQNIIVDLDASQLPQASSPCNEPQLVRVNRVVDGDTIYVQMGTREEKIRLIGINSPEIGYSGESSECFAEEAQQYLESLVDGKQLWLTFDITCKDGYGRWLAYVHTGLEEDNFVQRDLLQSGYGLAFPFSDTPTYNSLFASDEREAIQNQAGGWGSCGWTQ